MEEAKYYVLPSAPGYYVAKTDKLVQVLEHVQKNEGKMVVSYDWIKEMDARRSAVDMMPYRIQLRRRIYSHRRAGPGSAPVAGEQS